MNSAAMRPPLAERDQGGHAGGEDDEEQPDDDLIGCLWIVLLEITDNGPRAAEVHDAEAEETDDGGDGRDDLRHILDVAEQILDGLSEVHGGWFS